MAVNSEREKTLLPKNMALSSCAHPAMALYPAAHALCLRRFVPVPASLASAEGSSDWSSGMLLGEREGSGSLQFPIDELASDREAAALRETHAALWDLAASVLRRLNRLNEWLAHAEPTMGVQGASAELTFQLREQQYNLILLFLQTLLKQFLVTAQVLQRALKGLLEALGALPDAQSGRIFDILEH